MIPIISMPTFRQVSNITPFTVRSGYSYLEILNSLRKRINELIPEINIELNEQAEDTQKVITDLVNDINAAIELINETNAEIDVKLQEAIDTIVNQTIEISDAVVLGVINDDATGSNAYLVATFAEKSVQTTVETGRLSAANIDNQIETVTNDIISTMTFTNSNSYEEVV